MTRAALLLGERPAPGVLRWATALDAAYVAGVVRRAGGSFVALVPEAGGDVPGFHRAIARSLDFPDYYGHNLDALHDCLGDLPDAGRGVPVVWWDGWETLASAEPQKFAVIERLLGQHVCLVLRARSGM